MWVVVAMGVKEEEEGEWHCCLCTGVCRYPRE